MQTIRLIILCLCGLSFALAGPTDTLYILQTTDVHGNITPYNYFRDEPADYGLAKIYTRVCEYRLQHDNVLLLDGGDLIQGTPMVYYFNKVETSVPNPMILTMNYMGYDAFTVGNHDIEQGLFVYNRARSEADFPWLSANSLLPDGRTYFDPYTIIEINGIRVGIIGLTTPGIPMWLDEDLYPGISWDDMIATASFYAEELRPQVDVLVGLFHAGFNAEYSAAQTEALGLPNENASGLVAEQVPGFDVVFAGHSHREVPRSEEVNQKAPLSGKIKEETLKINAGSWGRNLGVARIILRKKGGNSAAEERIKEQRLKEKEELDQRWQIVEKSGWLESMKEVAPSPAIISLNKYYHEKTLAYIRREIAQLSDSLVSRRSRFEDTPFVELINKAQLAYTKADISFASSFNERFALGPGPLRIKDVYNMYWYENFLDVVEMTGRQIKDFLTYSAQYYVRTGGRLSSDPQMRGYNYDMAEGIKYRIKVNRIYPTSGKASPELKEGQIEGRNEVTEIILLKDGRPLDMNKTYRVAMNSYRATGGGGHLAAAGITRPKIVYKSSEEVRNILAEYITKQKVIVPKADGNWRVEEIKD